MRRLSILLACVLVGSLMGCGTDLGAAGKNGTGTISTTKSVDQVLEEQTKQADGEDASVVAKSGGTASDDSLESANADIAVASTEGTASDDSLDIASLDEAAGTESSLDTANADKTTTDNNQTAADGTAASGSSAMDEVNKQLQDAADAAENSSKAEGIDVDLTALSSTMVYSEVYNMMADPKSYLGKTVKMKGITAIYHDETDNNDYYACIVQDATACCAQGIEFQLENGDYPPADKEITVVGTFSTYEIEGYEYFTLKNAVMQ